VLCDEKENVRNEDEQKWDERKMKRHWGKEKWKSTRKTLINVSFVSSLSMGVHPMGVLSYISPSKGIPFIGLHPQVSIPSLTSCEFSSLGLHPIYSNVYNIILNNDNILLNIHMRNNILLNKNNRLNKNHAHQCE